MTITSHERGWPIYWDEEKNMYLYSDNNQPIDARRECFKCGERPTWQGHDACLGYIEGAVSACCGHGKEKPYTMWKGIRGWPQQIGVTLFNAWQGTIYYIKNLIFYDPHIE